MADVTFLKAIKDLLDTNDVEAAKAFIEGELRYARLQEIKQRETTVIYPFVEQVMDDIIASCGLDSPADHFKEFLVDFLAATKDAEIVVVHPVTYTALHVTGTDLSKIEIDPYWDSPEQTL